MRRLVVCVILAALAAILGPRLVGPQSRSAKAPFAYDPPEGFVPAKDVKAGEAEGAQVWVHEAADKKNFDGSLADRKALSTRIILTHSAKEMSVEAVDLAKLVEEMPKAFEGACTWKPRRHEMRTRADGARVGLIEGNCDREVDLSALGLPPQPVKMRKLQLMFPDDEGTSIVTASYPTDQATRWEPLVEATIGTARGVATRVPAPAPWTHGAWAAAGVVLGWLGTAILARKGSEPPASDTSRRPTQRGAAKARAARAEADDDAEADDAGDDDDTEDAKA
ncbi:MAG: hypothetical protein KF764_00095 [Labilithrix sp.]|nr:hypothetical protein [Labilithrix sp.]